MFLSQVAIAQELGRQTLPVNHNFTKSTVLLLATAALTVRLESMVIRKV